MKHAVTVVIKPSYLKVMDTQVPSLLLVIAFSSRAKIGKKVGHSFRVCAFFWGGGLGGGEVAERAETTVAECSLMSCV